MPTVKEKAYSVETSHAPADLLTLTEMGLLAQVRANQFEYQNVLIKVWNEVGMEVLKST